MTSNNDEGLTPSPAEVSIAPQQVPLVENHDRVVATGGEGVIGLNKCPKCGSAEIINPPATDTLQCLFCRHEWVALNADKAFGFDTAIDELVGTITTSGAADIDDAFPQAMTLKCGGCGAEVVVNTESKLQARCHWCRQNLSVNQQIPNGAVPDALLPFKVSREAAMGHIRDFVDKREFFAHKKFKKEFKVENVMGVYLPYMIVDGNVGGEVKGVGEIQTRRYTRRVGKNNETYYDADVYDVARKFDFTVDDLHIESSSERSNFDVAVNSNNILNAVLPFDTKNSVTFDANYMADYTSEKRDLNLDVLKPRVAGQLLTVARSEATKDAKQYDRGIRWETEHIEVRGSRWVSVYVPVWLYSYYEDRGESRSPFIHYIAVNGRTGKTMGSVPVSKPRLLTASAIIGAIVFALSVPLAIGGLGADDGSEGYSDTRSTYSPPPVTDDRYSSTDRFGSDQ